MEVIYDIDVYETMDKYIDPVQNFIADLIGVSPRGEDHYAREFGIETTPDYVVQNGRFREIEPEMGAFWIVCHVFESWTY
jgi:hypothetical protein